MKKTLLTGIRASGEVHLGNLLGAMLPAIEKQKDYQTYLFIADYHGLTTSPKPEDLQNHTRAVTAAWLAAGFDTEQSIIWKQSDVPEVLELSYILSCVTSMGLLERAHSYKDAIAKSKTIKAGLFYYPVLMAADILLYQSDFVPVGKDQAQHLEMTRDMATFFNETYGETFKSPKELIQDHIAVVPGIDGRKMSKSYNNGIDIFASEKTIKKQVMKILTDSKGLEESKDANTCVVYQLFKLVAEESKAKQMHDQLKAGGFGYGDAKKMLLAELLEKFDAMRNSYGHWMQHPDDMQDVLKTGAERARQKALKTMEEVRSKVGL